MGRIGSNCVDGRAHDYDGLRFGMFDWLVGWASHTWPAVPQCQVCLHHLGSWWGPCNAAASTCAGLLGNRAWRRSFSGMWLRGLVWWAPPSAAMHAAGHGHGLALASVSFPLVYEFGGRLQAAAHAPEHWRWVTGGFISYSEFLFGTYIWLVIASTLLGTGNGLGTDAQVRQTRGAGSLQASQEGLLRDGPRRDDSALVARLLDGETPELQRRASVGAWLCDTLSLSPLPVGACAAQHGCRWALRVLNAFHLVLSLGTMILLVITIVQNRFGMCEDC
jgi:hypothetical protein